MLNTNTVVDTLPPEIAANQSAITAPGEADNWLAIANTYEIDCPELAEAATDDLKAIKKKITDIEAMRVDLKKPILEAGRRIDAFFNKPLDLLSQAEKKIKGSLSKYLDAVARARQEAEEKQRRIENEQRKRAEAERDAEIEAARASGDIEKAEDLELAPPVIVPTAQIQVAAPTLSGVSQRTTYKARLLDKMELVKAIANGRDDLLGLLAFDQKAADGLARAMKKEFKAPGVEVYADHGVSVRG